VRNWASFSTSLNFEPPAFENTAIYPNPETHFLCIMITRCPRHVWGPTSKGKGRGRERRERVWEEEEKEGEGRGEKKKGREGKGKGEEGKAGNGPVAQIPGSTPEC